MRTKAELNLSGRQLRQMGEMLTTLTPAERRALKNPDFITEDEADLIVCDRRSDEDTVTLDEVLSEFGYQRRAKKA